MKVKNCQLIGLVYLIYLKTSIKIGHKKKLIVRIKSSIKAR